MGREWDSGIFVQNLQLGQTTHYDVDLVSLFVGPFNRAQFLDFGDTVVPGDYCRLRGNVAGDTPHVEGTKGQLRSRLTDRLCGNYTDGLSHLNHLTRCQVTTVAFAANAILGFTGQYRANLDSFDWRVFNHSSNLFRNLLTRFDDQFSGHRMVHIVNRGTTQDSFGE